MDTSQVLQDRGEEEDNPRAEEEARPRLECTTRTSQPMDGEAAQECGSEQQNVAVNPSPC